MKKIILVICCILICSSSYAASVIDTTGRVLNEDGSYKSKEDLTSLFNTVKADGSISYPFLYKKGSDTYCYSSGDISKQLTGWQLVDPIGIGELEWLFFDRDSGKMLKDTWTVDGYYVGSDGRIVKAANNARDYTTDGFKFLSTTDEFIYKFENGTSPQGCWVALSPLKNNIYYWYYFDYNGKLVTNRSDVQGKYKVNNKGQYVDGKEVVCFDLYPGQTISERSKPEFTDTTGMEQKSVLYNQDTKGPLGLTSIDDTVVYMPSSSKQMKFVAQIKTGNATNCEFDIIDRNFYDKDAEDNRGILRRAIQMNGSKASFVLKADKYNVYNLTYALEYMGSEPGTDEDKWAHLDIYIDGEHSYNDYDIYENPLSKMEIISELKKDILISFSSSGSDLNLILTADMKKDNSYLEDE